MKILIRMALKQIHILLEPVWICEIGENIVNLLERNLGHISASLCTARNFPE